MLNTITTMLSESASDLSSLVSTFASGKGAASVTDMLVALLFGVLMGFIISLV